MMNDLVFNELEVCELDQVNGGFLPALAAGVVCCFVWETSNYIVTKTTGNDNGYWIGQGATYVWNRYRSGVGCLN